MEPAWKLADSVLATAIRQINHVIQRDSEGIKHLARTITTSLYGVGWAVEHSQLNAGDAVDHLAHIYREHQTTLQGSAVRGILATAVFTFGREVGYVPERL
jgi:hypothetical protein